MSRIRTPPGVIRRRNRTATLDHLSRGRAAWNVVASPSRAEAQNFGVDNHLAHDERYERAHEFRGPLTAPRSPQGCPVLIQVGSFSIGNDFAARWAEAIVEIDPTAEGRRAYYDGVKSRAANYGRNPTRY